MPATIFVVEDEPAVALRLRDSLTQLGYLVTGTAARGEDALTQILARPPDLVLMDIRLEGDLDGIATATRLRQALDLPVVFVSGFSDTAVLHRAREVNPAGFLVKPIDERELHATLQVALYRHRLERELRDANAHLEERVREHTAELAEKNRELQQSQTRLELVLSATGMGSWHWDFVSGRLTCDTQACRLISLEPASFRGTVDEFEAVVHPDDLPAVRAALARARDSCSIYEMECRVIRPAGPPRYLASRGTVVRDAAGQPLYIAGITWDVTARRMAEDQFRQEAEQRMRLSEEEYRHVFQQAPIGIYRTTPDGRILLANPALVTMLGYPSAEALTARNLEEPAWFVDQPRSSFREELEHAGELRAHAAIWRRADGSLIHVSESVRVIRDAAGRILYYDGTVEDITARRQAETALQESEARFHGVFEGSPIPIVLLTAPDGRVIEANAAALSAFGYERHEVCGRTTTELGVWTRPAQREEFFRRIAAEKSVHGFEAVMRAKSGAERVMLCTGTLLPVAGQSCLLASSVDITAVRQAELEQARLQERMFQHQKFEALGTLAGGVAHDFNNILTGVINYTALAQADCPPSHPQIKEFLAEVLACGERAKDLVRQILLFSRAEAGQKEPMLFQTVLKEALTLLRSTLPATARIETDIDRQAPVVIGNPTQLHQVVLNLVINAAHALQGNPGRITVTLRPHAVDAAATQALPDLRPGPHLRLEVTDTGCGMAETVLARLFEPFFTTKPSGEGTGLGLAVVHSVIRSHGGAVAVRSQPGQGTTFEVFLPVQAGSARRSGTETAGLPRGKGEHILLVDDERIAGNSAKLLLDRLGYRVTVFTNPETALASFYVDATSFDAAIVDHQMPGMTGLVLAGRLLAHRSSLPVLMASGYTGAIPAESLRELGIARLLQKPFSLGELARTLHEVLAERLDPPGAPRR